MSSANKVHCPLPYIGLSLDAGLRRRICCHEDSFERINITKEIDINFDHISNENDISNYCRGCINQEKETGQSPRLEYIESININNENKIQFLDITFDPKCNLACLTCFPQYSEKVEQLYQKMNINYDHSTCINETDFSKRFKIIKTS